MIEQVMSWQILWSQKRESLVWLRLLVVLWLDWACQQVRRYMVSYLFTKVAEE